MAQITSKPRYQRSKLGKLFLARKPISYLWEMRGTRLHYVWETKDGIPIDSIIIMNTLISKRKAIEFPILLYRMWEDGDYSKWRFVPVDERHALIAINNDKGVKHYYENIYKKAHNWEYHNYVIRCVNNQRDLPENYEKYIATSFMSFVGNYVLRTLENPYEYSMGKGLRRRIDAAGECEKCLTFERNLAAESTGMTDESFLDDVDEDVLAFTFDTPVDSEEIEQAHALAIEDDLEE